jgi:hypothetical protein
LGVRSGRRITGGREGKDEEESWLRGNQETKWSGRRRTGGEGKDEEESMLRGNRET